MGVGKMKKETQPPKPMPSSDSTDLDEALSRIYERYGTDLQAFFRDAYKDALLKSREPDKNQKSFL